MQVLTPLEPGVYYHIYNRGVNRENIFREERNYAYFLTLYARHIAPVAETFAYCLLRNHFHLLVRIRENADNTASASSTSISPVSKAFNNFLVAYAKAINKAYGRTGALFQHHFGRLPVTSDRYFTALVRYIHYNPQKHGFVNDLREWPHSSYNALLLDQPVWLERAAVLDWFGGPKRYAELHAQWVTEAESRWFAVDDNELADPRGLTGGTP